MTMLPMNKPKKVNGLDTILPMIGMETMPAYPKLSAKLMAKQTLVSNEWNEASIAMIPTCFVCKLPLVWHTNPGADAVLFHCSKCGTEWKKDRKWNKDMEAIVTGVADV